MSMSARLWHKLRLVPLNDPSAAPIGLQLHTPIQSTCPRLHILDQTTEKNPSFSAWLSLFLRVLWRSGHTLLADVPARARKVPFELN